MTISPKLFPQQHEAGNITRARYNLEKRHRRLLTPIECAVVAKKSFCTCASKRWSWIAVGTNSSVITGFESEAVICSVRNETSTINVHKVEERVVTWLQMLHHVTESWTDILPLSTPTFKKTRCRNIAHTFGHIINTVLICVPLVLDPFLHQPRNSSFNSATVYVRKVHTLIAWITDLVTNMQFLGTCSNTIIQKFFFYSSALPPHHPWSVQFLSANLLFQITFNPFFLLRVCFIQLNVFLS